VTESQAAARVVEQSADAVPFGEAVRAWGSVSLRTFGGPAGQIAVMHRSFVEERRWIGEQRFVRALSYCTLLPGPEAQQLAIYLGWLLNGTRGGLAAGTLFVLPGFVVLMALSAIYVHWGETTAITAVFAGLAPAVLAIVAQAVVRLSRRVLHTMALRIVAVAAFVALFALGVPFPVVIGVAGLFGAAAHRWRPAFVASKPSTSTAPGESPLIPDDVLHGAPPSWGRALRIVVIGLVLWFVPVLVAAVALGGSHVLVEQGLFFSGSAVVTFGGAYAVLTFVAQQAVEVYRWLLPGEMVRGLALAETTPGPLIMVVQFVAFVGAYRNPGDLNPWVAALLGATLVVWVTFVPCFVFVFLGAPHIESLRSNSMLAAALAGISAAVVGIITNLGVSFAMHTIFERTAQWSFGPISVEHPQWSSLDGVAIAVAAAAFVMVFKLKWTIGRVLIASTCLGAALHLATTL
jgi:chromate transporter